jgi:dephospho-CoA kinase
LLSRLEPQIHREIKKRANAFLAEARDRGEPLALLDVPLLFETGMIETVDRAIVVTAPAAIQRERAMTRPGMTEHRLRQILARQMPDEETGRLSPH